MALVHRCSTLQNCLQSSDSHPRIHCTAAIAASQPTFGPLRAISSYCCLCLAIQTFIGLNPMDLLAPLIHFPQIIRFSPRFLPLADTIRFFHVGVAYTVPIN